jgi:hypothetical protein
MKRDVGGIRGEIMDSAAKLARIVNGSVPSPSAPPREGAPIRMIRRKVARGLLPRTLRYPMVFSTNATTASPSRRHRSTRRSPPAAVRSPSRPTIPRGSPPAWRRRPACGCWSASGPGL